MKEKSLFNHCLPQLLSTLHHSTSHRDHPTPPQSKYQCQPKLTTEGFPPHSLIISVSVSWAGQRWRGESGRGAEWEEMGTALAHFLALTQSFSSKCMSLFYIPDSFFKKLATFNLLYSTSNTLSVPYLN